MRKKKFDALSSEEDTLQLNFEPKGSSGTIVFAGRFTEEYLQELQGYKAAEMFDKMRRSDPRIQMVLSAVKNPLRSACWEFHTKGDEKTELSQKIQDHTQYALFEGGSKTWQKLLEEFLTVIEFGYYLAEVVHKVVIDDPQWGSYTGFSDISWRSPKTIQSWQMDPNGKLLSVTQIAQGDLRRYVEMPAQFLMHMALGQEGSNYEGKSMLRPCYGPWLRKNTFLKLEAIGIERFAIPTPVAKIPESKQNSAQKAAMIEALKRLTSHQSSYLTIPAGWEVEFIQNNFDPERVRKSVMAENQEIVFAFLANFLELGASQGVGSYAQSFNLSDFFLSGLNYFAKTICETVNQRLVKPFVLMNYGPQEVYPELQCAGISDRLGKELAETFGTLVSGKMLTPDDPLEISLRKRLNLPPMSDEGRRDTAPAPQPTTPPDSTPENGLKASRASRAREFASAKTPKALMEAQAEIIAHTMREGLSGISDSLIQKVMVNYRNASAANKVNAAKDVTPSGTKAYSDALVEELAVTALLAIEQAKAALPGVKVKGFAKKSKDKLPSKVSKRVTARGELLADTQLGDLSKAVFLQFQASVENNSGSEAILEADLASAATKYLEGAAIDTAATTTASFVVNESRDAVFNDDGAVDEIESFTYQNGDPQCPICEDLAGSVFRADDPEAERFHPPLHHNCKCYLIPNLNESGKEITGLKPSSSDLEKYISLSECPCP